MNARSAKILNLALEASQLQDAYNNDKSASCTNIYSSKSNLLVVEQPAEQIFPKERVISNAELERDTEVLSSSESCEDPFADNSDDDPNYIPSDVSITSEEEFAKSNVENDINEIISESNSEISDECNNNSYTQNIAQSTSAEKDSEEWTPINNNSSIKITEHTAKPIVNTDFERCKEPIDVFLLFVTSDIIDLLVIETNRYAEQQINNAQLKSKSRQKNWTPTNQEEMRNFLALIICTGLINVPNLHHYWFKNQLYHNSFISSIMTRDRFLLILKYLHFNNNDGIELTSDKLYRIRPLLTMLNSRFETVITPGRNVVIDESMVPWRGRLGMRQYIKNKRHKYGVKLYKVCTVEGYTYRVRVYCGKEDSIGSKGHSHNIVMNLMNDLLDSGRTLFADNFYTSVQLGEELLQRQTLYCGTLRSNRRGLPKDIIQKKIKQNEVIGVFNRNGIKIIKWQDKRPVLMLTSKAEHTISLQNTGRKNRKQQDVCKPLCIIDYNKAKKGVDYSDQMAAYYTTLRKNLKWYKKVAFELIFGAAIVNSWIVYNTINTNKKLSLLQFREKLAFQLIQKSQLEEHVNPSSSKKVHILTKNEGPGPKKRRNCTECYKRLRQTLTSKETDRKVPKVTTYCAVCENKPALCLPCFNEKHVQIR